MMNQILISKNIPPFDNFYWDDHIEIYTNTDISESDLDENKEI